jgi:hypothetical protein
MFEDQFALNSTGVFVSKEIKGQRYDRAFIAVVTPVAGEKLTINHGDDLDYRRNVKVLTESTKAPYAGATVNINFPDKTEIIFAAAGTYRVILEA